VERFSSLRKNPLQQRVSSDLESLSRFSVPMLLNPHPHLFRHTYATRLLKTNYSPDRVKYLLGHASIQTTLDVYSHVIDEANLFEVIEREESE
jgi:integrase/recombinase XerD